MVIDLVFIVIIPLLLLLLAGQPIMLAMALVGIVGIYALLGEEYLLVVGTLWWHLTNNFIFTMLPLFILMGEILSYSGITKRLYSALNPFFGRLSGGLLHTNIVSCAVFASISGSSLATVATIGKIAVPEMEKLGYDGKMIVGSVAGGATLGILIPPSVIMIIYGVLAKQSIGQLFIGGVIPGIITAALYMTYIAVRVFFQPHLVGQKLKFPSWKQSMLSLFNIVPTLLLIFLVLGTIYLGVATPTEAAAMGCAGALLLALAFGKGRLNLSVLKNSLLRAVTVTSMALGLMLGASLVSFLLGNLMIPRQLMQWVISLEVSPWLILAGIYLIYLILGCFFDAMSMMVLTLFIVLPTIEAMGYSLIWFGVVLVILIEAGLETPPVGMNLFVMQGIAPQYSFSEIVKGVFPFFLLDVLALIIITIFPNLVLWLPSTMIR